MLGAPPEISDLGSWWILDISQQPWIGYAWFKYMGCFRPKECCWTYFDVYNNFSLGGDAVVFSICGISGFFIFQGELCLPCARQNEIWVDIMILGTLLKKWCIHRSELIWGSGKKLWSNIVKKCEITMGLPQEYWLGGSPRNLQNFVVIIFPKISATIDRIWYMMTRCTYTTINTSCQISHSSPYPTSCEKHLSHAMLRKFWIFHISGGAMPSMCTPNQNLSWYYDSWDTFEKIIIV